MVKDKAKDIAILRTMGASSGSVLRIFLMAGASIGVLGTFIGFALGVLFCHYINDIRLFIQHITGQKLFDPTIYYLESLPAELDWREVVEIVLMALVLSVLATLYPSWRAAKIDPVETLRSE